MLSGSERKCKRVLVTGSEGFIGSHVVKTLESRGYVVQGYDIKSGYSRYTVQTLVVNSLGEDVLNQENLEYSVEKFKPDAIVHLAAQVFLTPSLENPQHDAMTNIIGTLNVLEAARRNDCRVVYSSSGAVYGSNDRSNIRETHIPEPMSPYGVSKLAAEQYCLLYHQLYGLPVVVFRFSSVYGQGRKKTSVNLILDKALKGEVIKITGHGNQTRDFTHVSDVVEAVNMAVDGKFPSGVYNIGTGTSTSLNELVLTVEDLLGKELTVEYVEKARGDPLRNDFNVEKAAQCGFKAKVLLRQGLKDLIGEMKSESG